MKSKTWMFILELIEWMNDFMSYTHACTHTHTLIYATIILQISDIPLSPPSSSPLPSVTSASANSLLPQSDYGICPSSFYY